MSDSLEPIPMSAIVFGDHVIRDVRIEELSNSIAAKGQVLPIVLSPLPDGTFLLEEGGRRFQANEMLGYFWFYPGNSCVLGRPGYVLKAPGSSPDSIMTELIGNLHRVDVGWREETRLLATAFAVKEKDWLANYSGTGTRRELASDVAKMCGDYSRMEVEMAVNVYRDLVANPDKYKNCNTLYNAYQVKLAESKAVVEKMLAATVVPKAQEGGPTLQRALIALMDEPVLPSFEPELQTAIGLLPTTVVPISSSFRNINSIEWMNEMQPNSIDHIVCDPDYGVSEERLNAALSDSGVGIAQDSVYESLDFLQHHFLPTAARVTRGFLVMWMDMDHWEKISGWATALGFLVQRWPIIWHKTDYRSNAAPRHNFCKNYEVAMICRKPSTTLAISPQMSSIIALPSGDTTKVYGHPFAKPPSVWTRLLSAVALPGETVYDPFMGSGTSCVAAIRHGCKVMGSELQERHYNGALLHVQAEYKKLLGENVVFA